jgi:hypothetical protein
MYTRYNTEHDIIGIGKTTQASKSGSGMKKEL